MDKDFAIELLKKTQEDYNKIALDFASKRSTLPKDFFDFLPQIKEKERILDLGCGNGRLWEVVQKKNVFYFGVDFSEKLLEIARRKYPRVFFQKANVLSLPFDDDFFDKIFSFSVLHHIPSFEFRLTFFREARRVLRKGGLFVLSVWNLLKTKKLLLFKHTLLKLFGLSPLDFKDIFYPWKDERGTILAWRYFHCFSLNELKKLAKEVGFKIKDAYKKGRNGESKESNLYLILEK